MHDFYCGRHGVDETIMLSSLEEIQGFIYDPYDDDKGVAIRDFFIVNKTKKKVSIEELEHSPIFLHGKIHSWTSPNKVTNVGNIGPLEAW